jgi:hypothetical protein
VPVGGQSSYKICIVFSVKCADLGCRVHSSLGKVLWLDLARLDCWTDVAKVGFTQPSWHNCSMFSGCFARQGIHIPVA